jgi:polysaccharide biosynthesis protein PslH
MRPMSGRPAAEPLRVLYVTTLFPYPPTSGGEVRSFAQLRIIASMADELTVASLTEDPVAPEVLSELQSELSRSGCDVRVLPPVRHPVHLRENLPALGLVAARRALLRRPYVLVKWRSRPMSRLLHDLLAHEEFDLVYLDGLGSAEYLGDLRARSQAAIVVEERNVETDFYEQMSMRQRGVLARLVRWEAGATAAAEARILAGVDAVVSISDRDRGELERLAAGHGRTAAPIVTVPVLADPQPVERSRAPRFGFLGTLSWDANRRGLDRFCQNVWPLVRARVPDAQLVIAGRGLGRSADGELDVPEAWQQPGVVTIGEIDRPRDLYEQVCAVVAPTEGGSGVRIKLIEAFVAGVPVVTDADGARGLPIVDEQEAAIARDDTDFAGRLVRIATDPAYGDRLVGAALDYLEEHHGADRATSAMRTVLERATGRMRTPTR